MKTPDLPAVGHCRCGQLSIEVSAPPLMTAACHCRGCQRMSASAFSLTALVPGDAFRVVAGEPVKGGQHGPQLDHYFCPHCKSWMFTRVVFTRVVGVESLVNVRPTMFDDLGWAQPFIETMTSDKLAWATTPARHSFEGFPSMDDLPKLIEEFAADQSAGG